MKFPIIDARRILQTQTVPNIQIFPVHYYGVSWIYGESPRMKMQTVDVIFLDILSIKFNLRLFLYPAIPVYILFVHHYSVCSIVN